MESMKLNCNFLGEGGGGVQNENFRGGIMDVWNCTILRIVYYSVNDTVILGKKKSCSDS